MGILGGIQGGGWIRWDYIYILTHRFRTQENKRYHPADVAHHALKSNDGEDTREQLMLIYPLF